MPARADEGVDGLEGSKLRTGRRTGQKCHDSKQQRKEPKGHDFRFVCPKVPRFAVFFTSTRTHLLFIPVGQTFVERFQQLHGGRLIRRR
jgi:hypothetical protein